VSGYSQMWNSAYCCAHSNLLKNGPFDKSPATLDILFVTGHTDR
jgi:hypothetical protein